MIFFYIYIFYRIKPIVLSFITLFLLNFLTFFLDMKFYFYNNIFFVVRKKFYNLKIGLVLCNFYDRAVGKLLGFSNRYKCGLESPTSK